METKAHPSNTSSQCGHFHCTTAMMVSGPWLKGIGPVWWKSGAGSLLFYSVDSTKLVKDPKKKNQVFPMNFLITHI